MSRDSYTKIIVSDESMAQSEQVSHKVWHVSTKEILERGDMKPLNIKTNEVEKMEADKLPL